MLYKIECVAGRRAGGQAGRWAGRQAGRLAARDSSAGARPRCAAAAWAVYTAKDHDVVRGIYCGENKCTR